LLISLQLYKSIAIDKSRVLIKLASTWEDIKAAHIVQGEHGVNCNLTLMFSLPQAIAGAEAGAFLVSPFVGRILDWYKAANKKDYAAHEDPGVKSVQQIFKYYKKYGYKTIVMGASFRNIGEITELAGCDYLTISVSIIEPRKSGETLLTCQYSPISSRHCTIPRMQSLRSSTRRMLHPSKKTYINDEATFRFDFNEEVMAVEKLREGISEFAADAITLKQILQKKIESA
jgi:transaldolase